MADGTGGMLTIKLVTFCCGKAVKAVLTPQVGVSGSPRDCLY